jgi:hypothetical protein
VSASITSTDADIVNRPRERLSLRELSHRWVRRPELSVAVVALVARILVIGRSAGGVHGLYDYDASVYYAAADGMVHGRVPYSGFTLVHPPLLPLMMTPFALLGRLTTASTGFIAANLATIAIGALNAVLVVRLGRRWGLSTFAVTIGGLVYAAWYGSVQSEVLVRLEPWCNTFLLAGLLALSASGEAVARRRPQLLFIAGAMLGLGASVKIWGLLSCAVVVAWDAIDARTLRRLPPILLGTVTAGDVINLPFLVHARGAMWNMVISSQLGRLRGHLSIDNRLGEITGLVRSPTSGPNAPILTALLVVVAAVLVVCCVASWRVRASRVAIALLVAHLVVLLASPRVYPYYADFMAVPFAMLLAGLTDALWKSQRRVAGAALVAIPLAAMAIAGSLAPTNDAIVLFPARARMVAAAAHLKCITSDTPMMLIELDALDRSFAKGCRDWVDVTAGVLGVHSPLDSSTTKRFFQPHWAAELNRYLLSGNGVILERTVNFGITASQRKAVDDLPVVATNGPFPLHATNGP